MAELQEHTGRSPWEVLRLGYEYLEQDIVAHLRCFALEQVAERPLSNLTRCQKVLLTLAKAFWPRAPHLLFVYEPAALGLEGEALDSVLRAFSDWSGGVLVAAQGSELPNWERWTL